MKVKVKVWVTRSYLTLCKPMDYYSSPGPSVHGILQARTLEWVAIFFSRGSSQPRDWTSSPALQADSLPSEPPGKPGGDEIQFKHTVITSEMFCELVGFTKHWNQQCQHQLCSTKFIFTYNTQLSLSISLPWWCSPWGKYWKKH